MNSIQPVLPYQIPAEGLNGKKLLFIFKEDGGLGDIACCLNIATSFVDRVGLKKEDISICANARLNEIALFNPRKFTVISRADALKMTGLALQIIIPSSMNSDHTEFLVRGLPTLMIREYGFSARPVSLPNSNCVFKVLGFNAKREQLGIYIDHHLAKWGFSPEAEDPSKRLSLLNQVSPSLRNAILGEGPFEEKVVEFTQTSILYTVYCSREESLQAFIKAIFKLQRCSRYVVVAPVRVAENFAGNPFVETPFYKENIKTLTIYKYDPENKKISLLSKFENESYSKIKFMGKDLTLICGQIHHDEFSILLKASEREVLVTGNQTLSEAISANKNFVYEMDSHTVAINEDLWDGWQDSMAFDPNHLSSIPKFENIFFTHKQPDFKLTQKNFKICQDKDCLPPLIQLCKDALKLTPDQAPQEAVDYIDNPNTFIPSQIPYNTPCYISLDQLQDLLIRSTDSRSDLPELSDSILNYHFVNVDKYCLLRKKNEDVSKQNGQDSLNV